MTELRDTIGVQRKAQTARMPGHGQGLQRGDVRRGRVQTVISGVARHQLRQSPIAWGQATRIGIVGQVGRALFGWSSYGA